MPFSFPASFYNRLVDTVAWAERQQSLAGSGQAGAKSSPTEVQIKNESGATVPRFGVLEVSNSLGVAQDFQNLKALKGVAPTSALGPVVIVQAAVADDDLAEAVIGGATMARVNVVATTDTHAEPVAGDSDKLKSGTAGRFRIINPPTSTGTQTLLVRFESASASGSTGLPKVKNLSGYTVPEWGFLMIDGAEPRPSDDLAGFKAAPVFRGVAPTPHGVNSNKRLVSVPGGAAPGETVDCVLDGRVPARIYSQYHADPLMVHLSGETSINDVTRLKAKHDQSNYGFPVLYRETGTGEKWGLVDLMPQNGPAAFYAAINGYYGLTFQTGLSTKWQGNPFRIIQATTASLQTAGSTVVDLLSDQTHIRIDGESDWFGEMQFTIDLTHPLGNIQGISALKQASGAAVEVSMGAVGGGTVIYGKAIGSAAPIVTSWVNFSGITETITVTVPFYYKAPEGRYVNNGSGFNVAFALSKSPLVSGNATLNVASASLFMHEVDPMLSGWRPNSGTVPGGGVLFSSGSGGNLEQSAAVEGSTVAGALVAFSSAGVSGNRGVGSGFGFE
jgi:hypothetical protein